jgi:hypothetical protein
MEMHAADVENPNNHWVAAAAADERAEPDMQSQLVVPCCLACMACTVLAAAVGLVVLFCRSAHASAVVRVLAGFGLVLGIVGLVIGACFCAAGFDICIRGNPEGTRQDEA